MPYRQIRSVCVSIAVCGVVGAGAQTPPNPAPAITIALQPSSTHLVAGAGLGVTALIENVSSQTVYLRETAVTLSLPLELEGSRGAVFAYPAFFPTEPHSNDPDLTQEQYFNKVISIEPGDAYTTFWTRSPSATSAARYIGRQIAAQLEFLFFRPGPYTLTVSAKYWTDPAMPADAYRTVTSNVTLPVTAPLFVILFGASIGGLIAYLVVPRTRPREDGQHWLVRATRRTAGALGAVLLSVIVTIMLSRIAGSQFVINVTVNDFWGAIAIGFAANYAGSRLFERFIPPDARQPSGQDGRARGKDAPAADAASSSTGA